jgi:hypothetical protein
LFLLGHRTSIQDQEPMAGHTGHGYAGPADTMPQSPQHKLELGLEEHRNRNWR